METQLFFYSVFLSQIFLLSFFFPRKMLNRIQYVFDTYPPEKFPNLYPDPIDYYRGARRHYRNMNVGILLAGVALLVGLVFFPRSGAWDGAIVNAYFMLQFFPVLLMEMWYLRYYRRMRKADARTTRKAELHPRRLFDFISPTLIGLVLLVYFAFVGLILYIRQFDFPWFGGYWNIVGVTAANLLFAGIVCWNLYGVKRDPYQSYEDRKRHLSLIAKQMVFMSIAMTLFIAIIVVFASLDMRPLQAGVTSIYLQLMAVIGFRTLRIDSLDFDVYKGDPNHTESTGPNEQETEQGQIPPGNTAMSTGLSLGLVFGAGVGLVFGELAIGAGLGMILGIIIGSRLDRQQKAIST
ncbi:MAG: hypothetical protein GKR89_19860 [Candidatus Latescibacteria bacterium]|nr:hypothetical protein [Candidatus Latescibacterota bacterium]